MNYNHSKWLIFGACNPMIDITATVDKDFLQKYFNKLILTFRKIFLNPKDFLIKYSKV